MNDNAVVGLIGLMVVAVVGAIIWMGVRDTDAKIAGCREAGGAMIGEICVIRNDCKSSVE
jgi:hypothetical protein